MSCEQLTVEVEQNVVKTCLEVQTEHECTILEPQLVQTCDIVQRGPQGPPGTGFGGDFVQAEVPSGDIDGVNMVYTTASDFSRIWVYLGGLRMNPGDDYNVTDTDEITFTYAPLTGQTLIVDYISA